MKAKVNLGVIGIGRMGCQYARYCAGRIPQVSLHAISDIREEVADLADELGGPKYYKDYRDLISDKEVDAIVVVTHTKMHKEVVIEAARQGKMIFSEKPLSLNLQEAREMQKAVEESGAFFQMGFMRRFDSGFAAAKRKIDEGVIGTPVCFKISSRDKMPATLEYLKPENSGGIFIDMGVHDFDLARWFMGDVKSVYSTGGALSWPEIEKIGDFDNVVSSLYFKNGSLGVIDMTRQGVYGYDVQADILGTNGALRIGYNQETPMLVMTKDVVTHDTVPGFYERFENAYITQLCDFVENILHEKEPAITIADGVAVLEIAVAATTSCHENRVVEL